VRLKKNVSGHWQRADSKTETDVILVVAPTNEIGGGGGAKKISAAAAPPLM